MDNFYLKLTARISQVFRRLLLLFPISFWRKVKSVKDTFCCGNNVIKAFIGYFIVIPILFLVFIAVYPVFIVAFCLLEPPLCLFYVLFLFVFSFTSPFVFPYKKPCMEKKTRKRVSDRIIHFFLTPIQFLWKLFFENIEQVRFFNETQCISRYKRAIAIVSLIYLFIPMFLILSYAEIVLLACWVCSAVITLVVYIFETIFGLFEDMGGKD